MDPLDEQALLTKIELCQVDHNRGVTETLALVAEAVLLQTLATVRSVAWLKSAAGGENERRENLDG